MAKNDYYLNLSIAQPDGNIFGIITDDVKKALDFLDKFDCEGSSLHLMYRATPISDYIEFVISEDVLKQLNLLESKDGPK